MMINIKCCIWLEVAQLWYAVCGIFLYITVCQLVKAAAVWLGALNNALTVLNVSTFRRVFVASMAAGG